MNSKEKELQKWLDDDRYVQAKELAELWGVTPCAARNRLRQHSIKPAKNFRLGPLVGVYFFYNRAECERILPFDGGAEKAKELQVWINDDKCVQRKELCELWGLSYKSLNRFLCNKGIKPVKRGYLGKRGLVAFYDRAECERARPFINQSEQKMVEKPINPTEPKQQTPDIIPADTIDSYTLKQLESELQSRGVEFTPVTAEIIRGSDMPELKQVAKMLDGEADSVILSGAKLGEIAGVLSKNNWPARKAGLIPPESKSVGEDVKCSTRHYLTIADIAETMCAEKSRVGYWLRAIGANGEKFDGVLHFSLADAQRVRKVEKLVRLGRGHKEAATILMQQEAAEQGQTEKNRLDLEPIIAQISRMEKELAALKNMLVLQT